MTTKEIVEEVLKDLQNPNKFPKIDLESLLSRGNVQLKKLLLADPIKKLVALFDHVGLKAHVGFNAGDEVVTMSLALLKPFEVGKGWGVVWVMLGLFGDAQQDIELEYGFGKDKIESLANQCLDLFTVQTQIAITEFNIDYNQSAISLRFDTMTRRIMQVKEGILYTDRMKVPFKLNNSYWHFLGHDPATKKYSKDYLTKQRNHFVDQMISKLWEYFENDLYFPDPALKSEVTLFLQRYLHSGIRGPSAVFTPSPHLSPLTLYLHGTAGIGKSSFVKNFSTHLRRVICESLEPKKRFSIVRVPLNAVNASELRKMISVRGISDWSIERIVEQTIARGGIAILHMEENPQNPEDQDALFTLTRKVVDAIVSRYPEYEANLLYIITSNYPPSETILNLSQVVKMSPPAPDVQHRWCRRVVEDVITEYLKSKYSKEVLKVVCDFEEAALPPITKDMRILEKWKLNIAFLISIHIENHIKPIPDSIALAVTGKAPHISIMFQNPTAPPLPLHSEDSYLYFPKESPANTHLSSHNIPTPFHPPLSLLTDMLLHQFLSPAVLVISPQASSAPSLPLQLSSLYLSSLQTLLPNKLKQVHYTLKTEEDKEKVFGSPSDPIMNGIFSWIESINGKFIVQEKSDEGKVFGVICIEASEMGQFMIRELLESGESKTHKNSVSKERIMFVVVVEDANLSPQLLSRAHFLIKV